MLAAAQPHMWDLIEMEALYAKKRQKTMAPACPYHACRRLFRGALTRFPLSAWHRWCGWLGARLGVCGDKFWCGVTMDRGNEICLPKGGIRQGQFRLLALRMTSHPLVGKCLCDEVYVNPGVSLVLPPASTLRCPITSCDARVELLLSNLLQRN